jgi:hypothetical protein
VRTVKGEWQDHLGSVPSPEAIVIQNTTEGLPAKTLIAAIEVLTTANIGSSRRDIWSTNH